MQIGVIGVNHKSCPLHVREQLTLAFDEIFKSQHYLMEDPFVLLSTCNRTEVYLASEDLPDQHVNILKLIRKRIVFPFEHWLYCYFESECFIHLAKVTSGLDSLLVGESEIQHQVKVAYEAAKTRASLCHDLHYLFQKSLKIGKCLRTTFSFYQQRTGLGYVVLSEIERAFTSLHAVNILFVGNSEINRKLIRFLYPKKFASITVCSRTQDIDEFKDYPEVTIIPRSESLKWSEYDVVVCGTKSDSYVINCVEQSLHKLCLVMDLSLPRNVNPYIARDSYVTLLNLEDLGKRVEEEEYGIKNQLEAAEVVLKDTVLTYSHLFEAKQSKIVSFETAINYAS